jgi:hypothetical protein
MEMNDQLHAATALSLMKGHIWEQRIRKALKLKIFYRFFTA